MRGNDSPPAAGSADSPRIAARRRRLGHVLSRASRCPITSGSWSISLAVSHGGASSGGVATIVRTSTSWVVRASAPAFVRRLSASRPAGLVSRGRAERHRLSDRGGRSRHHRAAWGLAGTSWLSRTFMWAPAHSDPGASGRFTENGRVSHRPPFRCRRRCPRTRRLAGDSNARALSRVSAGARSFEGPSNTRMEPARPTVLCDPDTEARGSFAALGAVRK